MIAQYTMLLLALRAAQFVHHVSVLSPEDITRGKGNFIQHARTQLNNRACARRMAEQTGIHDVVFRAKAKKERERWVLLKRPRGDIDGWGEEQ